MTRFAHQLDYQDKFPLLLDYDPIKHTLKIKLDLKSNPWSRLRENLLSQLQVYDTVSEPPRRAKRSLDKTTETLSFENVPQDFTLRISNEIIGHYKETPEGTLELLEQRKALSSEIRRMGSFHQAGLYEQKPDDKDLIEHAKTAVFTDFHTHSSGHISPKGLIDIALNHNAYYPTSLLEAAGIAVDYQRFPMRIRKEIERVKFPPRDTPGMPDKVDGIPLSALSPADLHKLKLRMEMPSDRQATYSRMENDAYRFRYPITKNTEIPEVVPEMLKQTAREFVQHGIKYAEIFYVGLDNPALLKVFHKTMEEIEHDPEFKGFKMRVQAGIPRGFTDDEIGFALENAKILTQSPYIVGVNFLGHEVTKTKKFGQQLHDFCAWAEENRPGLAIGVHAGENAKNPGNVEEVLDLALKFPHLHFGIGHGVYGLNKSALEKAEKISADPKQMRLRIESNPDSVLGLNNIDHHFEIPYTPMVTANIPFVIGSDSAGTYGTDAEQLGLAAYYGGLREPGFKKLADYQQRLMDTQIAYSDKLAKAVPKWDTAKGKDTFVAKMSDELGALKKKFVTEQTEKAYNRPLPLTDIEMRDKVSKTLAAQEVKLINGNIEDTPGLKDLTPVMVVGAGGESWSKVNPSAQREVAAALDMLAHCLDPNKAYFVQGRAKKVGLNHIANKALHHANEELEKRGETQFYSVGIIVDKHFRENETYNHLTHVQWIRQQYLDIAEQLANHAVTQEGICISAGGVAFTRDTILEVDQHPYHDDYPDNKSMLMLFENADGASADKAKFLDPDYRVQTGIDIVKKMYEKQPQLFRRDFDISKVNELYEQSTERVEEYGYEAQPDPNGQTVEGYETLKEIKKNRGS